MLAGGALVEVPAGLATFTASYALNFEGSFFLAAAVAAVFLPDALWAPRLLFLGLLLAFPLHRLVSPDWHYMLYDVKMLFFRQTHEPGGASILRSLAPGEVGYAFLSALVQNPFTYAGVPALPWGGVGASGFGRIQFRYPSGRQNW